MKTNAYALKILVGLLMASIPLAANAETSYTDRLNTFAESCKKISDQKKQEFNEALKIDAAGGEASYALNETATTVVRDCVDRSIRSASFIVRDEIDRSPIEKPQIDKFYTSWISHMHSIVSESTNFYDRYYPQHSRKLDRSAQGNFIPNR